MMNRSLILVILLLALFSPGLAELPGSSMLSPMKNSPQAGDTIRAYRVTDKPVIDGVFDEPFWKLAPAVTGFTTFAPDFDIVPKEQTEAAVAYDDENIYFAYRCYDDPAKIKTSLAERDKMISDDFICINLDAFNDHQGLNAFYVNPNGIQGDSKFAAGNEDFSPDYVWYSAGKIDAEGYSIEVQIPLKSLRYTNDNPTVMGIIFERYISRRSEHSCFPRLDPAKGFALLTQMFPVSFANIKHYTLFELLPAVTATRHDVREGYNLVKDKQTGEVSLTAKYGITSNLILDGTVNPDFSQVESDAGQVDVNLRYSLYYSEKRPFFLEGKDNFNLAANYTSYDPLIFYSRTIADPFVGAKLTGKIGSQNTIAALYSADHVLETDRPTLGNYVHVPVLRFKHALGDDSYFGFIYAGRELDNGNNRVAGYDEQYRLSDASTLESSGYLSWVKDNASSPSVGGNSIGMRYVYDTRNLEYNVEYRGVSDNFRADMGYLTRTGLDNFYGFARPKIFPNGSVLQRIDLEFTSSQTKDRPSGLWETLDDGAFNLYLFGNWMFRTRVAYSTEVFNGQLFQTSGLHTQLRAQITREIYANVLYRRIRSIYYSTPEQGKSNVASASLVYQPSDYLRAEGTFTYSDFYSDITETQLYKYPITRLKLTYQVNKALFFRTIGEYNDYRKQLSTDFLASFTYIPGTVVYLGYGSIFNKLKWDGTDFVENSNFLEMQRGLFLKMSYLWRT
jgi:hypothetical protein